MSQYIKLEEKHETKSALVLVVRRQTAVLTDKDLREMTTFLAYLTVQVDLPS
jgi:hypothetical protein